MQYITIELSLKTNQNDTYQRDLNSLQRYHCYYSVRCCSVIERDGKKYSYNYYKK